MNPSCLRRHPRFARPVPGIAATLAALLAIAPALARGDDRVVGPPAPTPTSAPTPDSSAPGVVPAPSAAAVRERSMPLGAPQLAPAGVGGDRPARAAPETAAGASPVGASVPAAGGVSSGGLLEMALPLAVVLGVILLVAWLARAVMSKGSTLVAALGPGGKAPAGVIEILGRYPIARGQMLVLVKLDRRVLLLGHTSAGRGLRGGAGAAPGGGFATLCDIDDPEQVASILWKVQEASGESSAQRFNDLLRGHDADEPEPAPAAVPARASRATAGTQGRGRAAPDADTWPAAAGRADDRWAVASAASSGPDAMTDLRQRLERLRLGGGASGAGA